MTVCPKCGKRVNSNTVFCPWCGANLESNVEFLKNRINEIRYRKIVCIACFLLCIIHLVLDTLSPPTTFWGFLAAACAIILMILFIIQFRLYSDEENSLRYKISTLI
ncbi:MAG: DUF7575 domain-containing protein [Candidatus Bathyarchaeia archaeon]